MADPLSIAASTIALATAAIATVKSLHETVKRFRDRDKTLGKLQHELEDLMQMLTVLSQAFDDGSVIMTLLQGPVQRCSQTCDDFKKSMEGFTSASKTGFRDWAKMEFRRGSIHDFIEDVASYKATLSVGMGIINIDATKVSQQLLQEYNELVQETTYGLQLHLQRIDEKLMQLTSIDHNPCSVDVDLNDEKEVTKQCLRICQDAKLYIEALSGRAPLLQDPLPESMESSLFEAQSRTYRALDRNRESLVETINHLQKRLNTLVRTPGLDRSSERTQLQADISISKQCLEICNMASDASRRKVHRIGEVIADGNSDQIVVTTLADLFEVRKAVAKDSSAQVIGSMTSEDYRATINERYSSRFGANTKDHTSSKTADPGPDKSPSSEPNDNDHCVKTGEPERSTISVTRSKKPGPNEVRKRRVEDDAQ